MNMSPHISEKFNGIIWRMEIDELSETIFVEIRNEAEKKVSFTAVNIINGEVYFKDITTPERWLTGIETAFDGVLLVHNYQSESGPAHKGLIAIDRASGNILWSNYTYAFDHLSEKGPVVYNTLVQPRKLFLLDIKTGDTVGINQQFISNELKNNVQLPGIVSKEFLSSKLLPREPFGDWIHYFEYQNSKIVSYHAIDGQKLTQLLYIFDNDHLVFEDLLTEKIQKIQPESFIIYKRRLIYIKNKSELKILTP